VTCPAGFTFGTDATFTANGTDPDGDALTYEWKLNDTLLTASTTSTITTKVNTGDVLSVVAIDATGRRSASATAPCTGTPTNHPPVVTLVCPTLTYGSPATFVANGTDVDGDALSYIWSINGTAVAGQTAATASLTIAAGDTVTVVASDGRDSSAAVTVTCTGSPANQPPTVEIACPANMIYNQPANFTATASDPDGDTLTYAWYVNGVLVPTQTSQTAVLSVAKTDVVKVVVNDGRGATASATKTCTGSPANGTPTVTINCPKDMLWGKPQTFVANGSDPDGDMNLTYVWMINGNPVPGESGAAVTLTLQKGEVLSVSVTDSKGASSAPTTSNCEGNTPPQITLACPEKMVWGEPTQFVAAAADADSNIETFTYEWTVNGVVVADQTTGQATLTVNKGDVVKVKVTDSKGASVTGGTRPKVAAVCPKVVPYGEPITLTANGTDADDNDSLTYHWLVNGKAVTGVTGATASLTLTATDVVTVTVSDTLGNVSTPATFSCVGGVRPTVTLACANPFVANTSQKVTAVATDPDGKGVLLTWAVNGTVLAGESGTSVNLKLSNGDSVSVNALSAAGLVSKTTTVTCTETTVPTTPTTIPSVIPAAPQVLGSSITQAVQRAVSSSQPYSLPITGGSAAAMALIALVSIGAGAMVMLGRRRRTNSVVE
jgi:hypothetical protein